MLFNVRATGSYKNKFPGDRVDSAYAQVMTIHLICIIKIDLEARFTPKLTLS
jgi:hypothetical protein